jgi:hypothetical protein
VKTSRHIEAQIIAILRQADGGVPVAEFSVVTGSHRRTRCCDYLESLNAEEPGVILAELQPGSSLRQIGQLLGRHHGTIGLELTRGAAPDGYDPHVARLARDAAQLRSR